MRYLTCQCSNSPSRIVSPLPGASPIYDRHCSDPSRDRSQTLDRRYNRQHHLAVHLFADSRFPGNQPVIQKRPDATAVLPKLSTVHAPARRMTPSPSRASNYPDSSASADIASSKGFGLSPASAERSADSRVAMRSGSSRRSASRSSSGSRLHHRLTASTAISSGNRQQLESENAVDVPVVAAVRFQTWLARFASRSSSIRMSCHRPPHSGNRPLACKRHQQRALSQTLVPASQHMDVLLE